MDTSHSERHTGDVAEVPLACYLTAHFNQTLKLWCVFALCVIQCHTCCLYRLSQFVDKDAEEAVVKINK